MLYYNEPFFLENRAVPIARALELGADVVVTGRCVDSALALGPLMYEVKSVHVSYLIFILIELSYKNLK